MNIGGEDSLLLIGVDEICRAREHILLTFTARRIKVDPHSELCFVLDQMEHYCLGTRDLKPGDTHSGTDDQAVEVGRELLRGLRLHGALVPLLKGGFPISLRRSEPWRLSGTIASNIAFNSTSQSTSYTSRHNFRVMDRA